MLLSGWWIPKEALPYPLSGALLVSAVDRLYIQQWQRATSAESAQGLAQSLFSDVLLGGKGKPEQKLVFRSGVQPQRSKTCGLGFGSKQSENHCMW